MERASIRAWSRRQAVLSIGFFALGKRLGARQDQAPTFSSEVKVVNILATVHDKSGAIVRNLPKDDFEVYEDGRKQAIRYFSQESDLPLTIGVLVDTSLSQARVLEEERAASYRFLDEVLREGKDKAVIVQFDQAVMIRQGLTSSHKELQDTLELLNAPTREEAANGSGTLLYDAVREASVKIMREQQGRKAFIVLTDGVDVGSTISLPEAIESAQRADTLIYSILFSDESYYGGRMLGPSGAGVLKRLSKETGGGYFEASKKQSIADIYDAIQKELRSEYSIGFVSDKPVTKSGFRSLRVVTKSKGLAVQARDRYYAET
ncbi:MAG: VWA domain-containing protein [Acidobacteriaceae bacterium]|nr:VWA domain-containing protein [Acidobacteriaceae bacterium]